MSAPPTGHSGTWVEVCLLAQFSESLICLLGLDSSKCGFGVSPEVHWVTVLSSSLSVISQYFAVPFSVPFGLPTLQLQCVCGQVVEGQKECQKQKTMKFGLTFMESLLH